MTPMPQPSTPRGLLPVLAVPFHADGALDLDGFDAICHHVLGCDVDGALLFGLASEFHKLTDDERRELRGRFLTIAREHPGRLPIVSVTAHATRNAVADARAAAAEGAGAINLLPPHFLGPSAADVRDHLSAVLDAVDVPVIVQYAPAQTGTALDGATLRQLRGRHPNLSTVKVESLPSGRFISDLAAGDPAIDALVGYAGLHLPDALLRGAVGVQPGCSFTEVYVPLWRAHLEGRTSDLAALHRRMLPFLSAWMQHVELIIQVEKTILRLRGIIADDHCRAPGWRLDAVERSLIEVFLHEFAAELDVAAGPVPAEARTLESDASAHRHREG